MSQVVDTFGYINNRIKVAAGHYVDLAAPDPTTIEIKSIAAALSKICRFGGHCPKFYSVAEHCIHATLLAVADGVTSDALVAVFLHDAAEAYLGDMVRPIKANMPAYMEMEQRIESAIELAFGIEFGNFAATIKLYDRTMLKAEKMTMWSGDGIEYEGFADMPERQVNLQYWSPTEAEMQFLAMARSLQIKGWLDGTRT